MKAEQSLENYEKELNRLKLEIWLWRGGTALGVIGTILALLN